MTGIAQHVRKLVTIITESSLEKDLVREFDQIGVKGYTITDARGRGSRGQRSSSWGPSGNIRIEIICDITHAEALTSRVHEKYYANYAMVLYIHDVEVVRPAKFD